MRHAGQWANENNCSRLMVVTTEANAAANGLYSSLEFQLVNKYHYRIEPKYEEKNLTTSLNLPPVDPLPEGSKIFWYKPRQAWTYSKCFEGSFFQYRQIQRLRWNL